MYKKCVQLVIAMSLVFIMALVGWSAPQPSSPAAKTLVFGEIENLTGPASDVLKIAAEGAQIAKQYINDRGGITVKGEKYLIDIVLEDNKMSTEAASTAATFLINKGIKFIVGSFPPVMTIAINTVTEQNGVLYSALYHNGTKAEYGPQTKMKFIVNNSSLEGTATALAYLKELHPEVKTVAYILADTGNAIRDTDALVRKIASDLGLSIQGKIVGWTLDTVDFSPVAQKAIVLKPDAIMTGNGSTEMSGSILRLAREMGYTKPIFGCNYNPIQDIISVAGKAAAKNYFIHSITQDAPNMPAITKEIMKASMAKYGRLDYLMLAGFNAIYTTTRAIEKAQSLDPKVVAASWEKMDTIDTALGPGKMGGMQTYGIRHSIYHPIPIMRLENGQITFGKWVNVYRP